MQVKHITTSIMITATCWIHQTGRIILFCPFSSFNGLKLSPSLIKWHPGTNARIRIQTVHYFFPFFAIISFWFGWTLHFRTIKVLPVLPLRVAVTTRHVLPHNNSKLVAICIPTGRLYFNMFTDHIITKIFCLLNVIQQSFIRRSRIQTVRPPTLIKRAKLEQRFIIQFQTYDTIGIPASGIFTHGRIAIHLIHNLIPLF